MTARVLLVIVMVSGTAQASAQTLANWLEREAIAEIAETLSRHPRFRGEEIEIGPLHDGVPGAEGTELGAWIEQRITEALLDVPGVQLRSRSAGCPEDAADVYLGIAIDAAPGGRFHVALRFIDRVEGTWISGVGASWEGYLSRAQREALAARDAVPAPAPAELTDTARIADRMARDLICRARHPGALPPAPWRIEPGRDTRLNALAAELGRRLPKYLSTAGDATPLVLEFDADSGRINLSSGAAILASIAVSTAAMRHPSTGQGDVPARSRGVPHLEVREVAPQGVCQDIHAGRCLLVTVRAADEVHSRLLLTYRRRGEHRLRVVDCAGSRHGARRLRIAIDQAIDAAPISVYLLASDDPASSEALDRVLGEGRCDQAADDRWIARIADLDERTALTWQRVQIEPARLAAREP